MPRQREKPLLFSGSRRRDSDKCHNANMMVVYRYCNVDAKRDPYHGRMTLTTTMIVCNVCIWVKIR